MTTSTHLDVENLHDVLNGNAVYSNRTVTFGTRAGGGNVSMILTSGERARNTLIVGGTNSGKTGLLESLREGTERAGVDVHLASPLHSDIGPIVADTQHLIDARSRDGSGGWPLRLLLVDDLTEVDRRTADALAEVARMGPKTNVAVVAATQDASARMPGGAFLRDSLRLGGLIEFRTYGNDLPDRFADGTTTAGVGFVNGDLFRAWWPGN